MNCSKINARIKTSASLKLNNIPQHLSYLNFKDFKKLSKIKDTLKTFDNFKSKQQVYE